VLLAPRLRGMQEICAVLQAIDRPLNVLVWQDTPPIGELAQAGVSRVSTGSSLAFTAYGVLVDPAREPREAGTYDYLQGARVGYYDGARHAFAQKRSA
jgi:2-methylisocitrate lyase-like PEP mutase family enzyme